MQHQRKGLNDGELNSCRSARGWLLVDGVITLVLAVLIWSTWPSSALWVVGTLVGISMFFSGITRLILSMAVRRIVA
jgi:uncharacterized membrane protein HdeD (DUF308 family)